MKFPQAKNMTQFSIPRILVFLICVGLMTITAAAQGNRPEAQPPNLDQCANGPNGDLACTGSQWQNGNLNQNQAKWVEGDSVPYRVVFGNLVIGDPYTVTIQWDTTEGTAHAIDYITTWDRSIPAFTGNPCSGVTGCTLGSATTFPIPLDPRVAAASVTQIPGNFTMYGATITAVSVYSYTGPADYSGTTKAGLTITFTATETNAVLAWGGHIARRVDWGLNNTAVNLSGSPYHMRLLGVGNQDRSLSVEAVIFPASVTIVKLVTNLNLTYSSTYVFNFTRTVSSVTTPFTLVDSDPSATAGGSFNDSNVQLFGSAGTITVTENLTAGNRYVLVGLSCTETGGTVPVNTTWDVVTRTATIVPDEGEFITCTFSNQEQTTTASSSDVSGRVVTSFGQGIGGARLTLLNPSTGEVRTTLSNQFGYYRFVELTTGDFYYMTVRSKRYTFANDTQSFTLNDNITGLDFTANP